MMMTIGSHEGQVLGRDNSGSHSTIERNYRVGFSGMDCSVHDPSEECAFVSKAATICTVKIAHLYIIFLVTIRSDRLDRKWIENHESCCDPCTEL